MINTEKDKIKLTNKKALDKENVYRLHRMYKLPEAQILKKMEKEFNLSNKRRRKVMSYDYNGKKGAGGGKRVFMYLEEDIKEFIKRLKEHPAMTNMCSICAKEMNKKIDKSSGDKLT